MKMNPKLFSGYENTLDYIKHIINKGEGKHVEFKSTLRTNLYTKQVDKKMEHSVMKTIAAFMNTDGGTLLVGVEDNGSILGIENDNYQSVDNYHRHFTNLVRQFTGDEYLPFVKSEIVTMDGKRILKVDCIPSNKGVFLKVENGEEFYVRTGPSTVKLEGSKLISYVDQRFKNR
jgi:predicted HTH transcriptional regulator